jgi:hypothetical protein
MTAMVAGQSRVDESQGAAGPVICADGVLTAEMVCRVDPGMSILEGINVEKNWATDFGGMVGGGGGDKAGEAEDVLGLNCKCPGQMAMAITLAPAPALACVVGVTGKGRDGKDVPVLIAVFIGRGVKPIIIILNFLVIVPP